MTRKEGSSEEPVEIPDEVLTKFPRSEAITTDKTLYTELTPEHHYSSSLPLRIEPSNSSREVAAIDERADQMLKLIDEGKSPIDIWRKFLDSNLLTSEQVQIQLRKPTIADVAGMTARRELLGLPTQQGELLFPEFQFTERSKKPFKALPAILEQFDDAAVSQWTIASWFTTRQGLLSERTPVDWLRGRRDSKRVVEAAKRTAARLNN